MFHSRKIIYALLLTSAILCGCSQREDFEVIDNNESVPQENASVVFRIKTNTTTPSLITRSVEDSYSHEPGTETEYQVNNARVYLFDAPTKLFVKSVLLKNLKLVSEDVPNNIVYETEHELVPQGTYDIFVIANTDIQISKKNEADFLASIDSITYLKGRVYPEDISKGIVMTNRASDNTNVLIEKGPDDADNVVNITLERVLARIDVARSNQTYALTDKNSQQYATITLDGYYIVNLPKYYYPYRHVAVLTSMNVPVWSLPENYSNVSDVNGYVIDPYFFKKTIDAAGFTNADKYYEYYLGDLANVTNVSWTAFKQAASDGTPQYNTIYSPENCMFAPAQKNGYSTGVIFKAKVDPYNSVYTLNNGSLELVTDKTKYPEVIYYFNYKFYDSPEALAAAIGVGSISGDNLDLYKAKKFEKTDDGYRCYYNYWIRHLDNNKSNVMGVMEFAIVRNNLYKILVTNVSGLGYQEISTNPDTPDEGETYLKVVLNVKPWIIRDLHIVL